MTGTTFVSLGLGGTPLNGELAWVAWSSSVPIGLRLVYFEQRCVLDGSSLSLRCRVIAIQWVGLLVCLAGEWLVLHPMGLIRVGA